MKLARTFAICLLVGAADLVPLTAAGSERALRQTAVSAFSDHRTNEDTGTRLRIDYFNPDSPKEKPPAVRRIVTIEPKGATIDTSVPARCHAPDAELMLEGAAACPEASRVGGGHLRLDTGLAGPTRFFDVDFVLFNEADQLIFLSTIRGTEGRVVTRARVDGRSVIAEVPMLPGSPPDGAALDFAWTKLASISVERGPRRGSYIRTPRSCPRRGYWIIRNRFTYADGVTQTVPSRVPCRRG